MMSYRDRLDMFFEHNGRRIATTLIEPKDLGMLNGSASGLTMRAELGDGDTDTMVSNAVVYGLSFDDRVGAFRLYWASDEYKEIPINQEPPCLGTLHAARYCVGAPSVPKSWQIALSLFLQCEPDLTRNVGTGNWILLPKALWFDKSVNFSDDAPVTIKEYEFAGDGAAADGSVTREGVIFECGDYPDKGFSLTEAEADAAIAAFTPVPLTIQHQPDSALPKSFLASIRREGKSLLGSVRMPSYVDALIPSKRVSASWHPETKTLLHLSLTPNPKVAHAALFTDSAGAPATNKETEPMTAKEWFAGLAKYFTDDVPAEFAADTPVPKAPVIDTTQLDALKAQLATERAKRIATEAANFASEQITACKATPNEKDAIVAAYTVAATNDAAHGAVDFAGAQVTAVAALTATFAARQPHALLQTLTPEQVKLLGNNKGADFTRADAGVIDENKVDEAYVAKMREMTGLPAKGK